MRHEVPEEANRQSAETRGHLRTESDFEFEFRHFELRRNEVGDCYFKRDSLPGKRKGGEGGYPSGLSILRF